MPIHIFQSLPRNSQIIAHPPSTINRFVVVYRILETIRGSNSILNHQVSVKDIELCYHLIGRLLFTRKITRPNVQACVAYIFTTYYCKDRILNTDILFVKKI